MRSFEGMRKGGFRDLNSVNGSCGSCMNELHVYAYGLRV